MGRYLSQTRPVPRSPDGDDKVVQVIKVMQVIQMVQGTKAIRENFHSH